RARGRGSQGHERRPPAPAPHVAQGRRPRRLRRVQRPGGDAAEPARVPPDRCRRGRGPDGALVAAVIETPGPPKRYRTTRALSDLALEVRPGEILGYLGPNGAGKTTTIRLLLGLISPTAGSATIFGMDVAREAPAVHRRLAYCPGDANLWPGLTGAETLALL